MKQYFFEKLEVWQRARILVKEVYQLTQKMPPEEKFGLTAQIRRAALSVTCNLVEGVSRTTGKEQARYSEIAYGSLMEVLNLLILSADLSYITTSEMDTHRTIIEEISHKINQLRKSQLAKKP